MKEKTRLTLRKRIALLMAMLICFLGWIVMR